MGGRRAGEDPDSRSKGEGLRVEGEEGWGFELFRPKLTDLFVSDGVKHEVKAPATELAATETTLRPELDF